MNDNTLMLRQVNKGWIQNGRVTSQAFKPSHKDNKRLSVYDGDKISPKESWQHFTNKLKYNSIGVLAVTVQECKMEELSTQPDPEFFPEHAVIIFEKHSGKQIRKKARHLKKVAEIRGWLYEGNNGVM